MALTPKKRAFVDALRGGASNKDAAIAAGYAASSASAAGSRLAKDPYVMAAMAGTTFNKKGNKIVKAPAAQPAAEVSQTAEPDDSPGFDLSKVLSYSDPKAFLLAAMNDHETEKKLRVDAAKALMPFMHQRKGETGKKTERENAAKVAGAGRFGSSPPPLKAVK